MNIGKKGVLIIIITIIFVLGFYILITNMIEETDQETEELGIPTRTLVVKEKKLTKDINYMGTVEARDEVIVSPKITSDVVEMYVEEGESVQAGDMIAKLDDNQLTAAIDTFQRQIEVQQSQYDYLKRKVDEFHEENPAVRKYEEVKSNYEYLEEEIERFYQEAPVVKKLEEAESNYEHLKNELDRYEQLYRQDVISEQQYEEIKHEKNTAAKKLAELEATVEDSYRKLENEKESAAKKVEELEATVDDTYKELEQEKDVASKKLDELSAKYEELQMELSETEIIAPLSGEVKELKYSSGELAAASKPLAIIDDVEDYIVRVNVAESDIDELSRGTRVVVIPSLLNVGKEGEIVDISTGLDPRTRMGEVEVGSLEFDEDKEIYVGSSAEAKFIIEETEDVVIPAGEAIKKLIDKQVVYVYKDGKVHEREVETGLNVGDKVQVLEGLEPGDKIAIRNIERLYDGAKVFVYEGEDDK